MTKITFYHIALRQKISSIQLFILVSLVKILKTKLKKIILKNVNFIKNKLISTYAQANISL